MEIKIKKKDIPINKIIEVSKTPKIIIFNNGKKYFVISGICPHAKWPLEMGEVKEKTLTCAGHGWEFDITNGACTSNPGRNLIEYKIDEKDSELIISKK
jgi:nitrite reductase/ring-hydroxylating ferredoxin subunit